MERFLKVERIADADDFFELGGHSLIAMRMTLLLRRTFKSDVGIEILLENPPVPRWQVWPRLGYKLPPGTLKEVARYAVTALVEHAVPAAMLAIGGTDMPLIEQSALHVATGPVPGRPKDGNNLTTASLLDLVDVLCPTDTTARVRYPCRASGSTRICSLRGGSATRFRMPFSS